VRSRLLLRNAPVDDGSNRPVNPAINLRQFLFKRDRAPWPEVDEEGWWREVLADRRLRRSAAKSLSEKEEDVGQALDHLPVKSLTFSCEWCGQRATLKVAELIAMFGRERNVRSIGRHVLKCRDRRSRREGDECPIIFQA
jgi:hypothetical protein